MSAHPEEEALGKAYDSRLIRRLLHYLRPYRGRVVLAVALLTGVAALELVGPYLTKVALDRAIPERDAGLLGTLAALYLATLLAGLLLEYGQTVLTTWLGQRIQDDLRQELFTHLQRLSLRYFDKNPVGRLMTRVINDVEVLNELFTSGVVTVFGDVFTLVFILSAMLLLNWKLALVTFLVLPLVWAAAFVFRRLIREAYREINAYLQEHLSGMRVVQLFGREPQAYERFERINRDHLDVHLKSITYYALFFPVIEVLTATALALILWYGGGEVLRAELSIGVIAAFLQYARRFFRPIQDLSEKYNILQGAMASSERIFQLLDTEPEIRDDARPLHLPVPGRGEIEFREVWFSYAPPGVGFGIQDSGFRGTSTAGPHPPAPSPNAGRGGERQEVSRESPLSQTWERGSGGEGAVPPNPESRILAGTGAAGRTSRAGFCAASPSSRGRASAWRSWGPPAQARAPSSRC